MLTPYFELSQTDKYINLLIKAPLANISKTELVCDGDSVIFYSSPYYLRIHLPGSVVEDETASGQYNADNGEFVFNLLKVNYGQYFEDLDLIGKLLQPRRERTIRPSIEVLAEDVGSSDPESIDEDERDNNWYISQEAAMEEDNFLQGPKYGFANQVQGRGREMTMEFSEVFDLRDIQETPTHERILLREEEEITKFSEDHYLADFMEPGEILQIKEYVPPWERLLNTGMKAELTHLEKDYLKNLGNKEYLLDSSEQRIALLSLADIVFAYAYNHRTTYGDNNVESAWTINKLSATLSWLQTYRSIREVKVACIRRSLIYPLFRNWSLTMTVLRDTYNILSLGRRQVLKCLLEMHSMFNNNEPRYVLNQLYITDYCIWLQKVPEKKIIKLANSFDAVIVEKYEVGLDLEELETAAVLVQEEELEVEVIKKMDGISIRRRSEDSSSEESSEDYSSGSSVYTDSSEGIDSDDYLSAEL